MENFCSEPHIAVGQGSRKVIWMPEYHNITLLTTKGQNSNKELETEAVPKS